MATLNITIPVYNEEMELGRSINKLHTFLTEKMLDYDWQIIIADNASTDKTLEICRQLTREFKRVNYIHLSIKGRGRAVKKAWIESNADICSYMDVDLSTDLNHFRSLINSLSDGYDMAIGSRLTKGAHVQGRTLKREITSRCYNLLIKLLFWTKFSDAQCGFKAVNKQVVKNLIPLIQDNEWFFDSELLIVGEKLKYKIFEVPVTWVDDLGTTVKIMKTAGGDLQGLFRLFITRPWLQK